MLSDDEIEAIAQEHVRKLDRFTRPELPMPNGKPGDNPLTDMFSHGLHPFPADMEAMLRKLYSVRPGILSELGWEPFDWEAGRDLDAGRDRLRGMLRQHGIDLQDL